MPEASQRGSTDHRGRHVTRVAFLLAQLGEHAAEGFTRRIAELDLTPPQAGLLRTVGMTPGQHQQEVARQLGMTPSRFVAFVDTMETRGLIERRRDPEDRRFQRLYLTPVGEEMMDRIGDAAAAHEDDICSALDTGERQTLAELLGRVASAQGLAAGVHPGYRRLGSDGGDC
jgi:DNA-binding MarR family transcriptional regulator